MATGAAFHDLTNQMFSAQGSLSYGWHDERSLQPLLEVEFGATFDSRIFNGNPGGLSRYSPDAGTSGKRLQDSPASVLRYRPPPLVPTYNVDESLGLT